ncbi:ESPR-type extended signal peptide-containing protein, partial [Phocoenobacter skyensis]
MNSIYKIVFNKATQTFTAVSELAKGATKTQSQSTKQGGTFLPKFAKITLAISMVLGFSTSVMAVTDADFNALKSRLDKLEGVNNTTSNNSIAIGGNDNLSIGRSITLGGLANKVKGDYSTVMGGYSLVEGQGSFAYGTGNIAKIDEIAGNLETKTIDDYVDILTTEEQGKIANGTATAEEKVAMKNKIAGAKRYLGSFAWGNNAFAFGRNNVAGYSFTSVLGGINNRVSGIESIKSAILTGADNKIEVTVGLGMSKYNIWKRDSNGVLQFKSNGDADVIKDYDAVGGYTGGSIIAGGAHNVVTSAASFVGVGINNRVEGIHGNVIIGGESNTVGQRARTSDSGIFVGEGNAVDRHFSSIVSGQKNSVLAQSSSILTGKYNTVKGGRSAIIAGSFNKVTGNDATATGVLSYAEGQSSFAGGAGDITKIDEIAGNLETKAINDYVDILTKEEQAKITNDIATAEEKTAMKFKIAEAKGYLGGVAKGEGSFAFGQGVRSYTAGSMALGTETVAGVENGNQEAVAMGYRAKAIKDKTLALGFDAKADHTNSVALGSNAETRDFTQVDETEAINGLKYKEFSGIADGVVSVGKTANEKQIINVAPGEISQTSTDAINGSQLFATNTVLGNVATSVKDNLGGNAAID